MSDGKNITIQFLGAAGTVTGSKYFIEFRGRKLMVDCGLFQGLKELRLLNWEELPIDASQVEYVFLTHGHLDHVGYLPRLYKAGFRGEIYGTAPTLDIAKIILNDSAKIQEEEADQANRYGYSKHKPAVPLYNLKDVEKVLPLFKEITLKKWVEFGDDIKLRYQTNSHIIGSAFIEMDLGGKRLVFSGDVGQEHDLIMYPPKRPEKADVLFVESTYGDRLHKREDIREHLRKIIVETIKYRGTVIIPSFAVERTQTLMYLIWKLHQSGELPHVPCIMDSPMGANVLEVFERYPDWHKLSHDELAGMSKLFRIVREFKETEELIADPNPKIVIAGSGMVSGGRVLHYLREYLDKPETTVLMVGFQGEGTRGRHMMEGANEVKIYGKYFKVKAKIETIEGLSAHGDQQEILDWMSGIKNTPEKVFLIHGERQSADTFRVKIKDTFGWKGIIPKLYEKVIV